MGTASAIRLPNGKILTRLSSRDEIWSVRRDAIMGKLAPGNQINALTYSWLNESTGENGDGSILDAVQAPYGKYELGPDYPYFAIYDPACYQSFVSNYWDFQKLREHFIQQMSLYRILVGSCGMPADRVIEIKHEPVLLSGVRESSGSIMSAGSRLILCDYGHLTMGAQFSDIKLPDDEPFGAYEIKVSPGTYNIRVIQMRVDPFAEQSEGPDLILEILKARNPLPAWTEISWYEKEANA